MSLPKTLQKLWDNNGDKISEIFSERCDGEWNGYWINLHAGWALYSGEHAIHEDTVKECLDKWKGIQVCNCDDCKATLMDALKELKI